MPTSRAGSTGTTRARALGKVDALDGLRGAAVLLVVLHHLPLGVPWMKNRVVRGGEFGVDAFFVLSGFLITALMLRDQSNRGRIHIGAFYRRRAMRILPALMVFLGVYWLYATATDLVALHVHAQPLWYEVVNDILKPWRRLPLSAGISHLWSLAVEEQFYLLWPLCVALFLGIRRRTTTAVLMLVALIVAVAVHRAVLWDHGVPWPVLYTRLDTRADALLVGCLLAHLWARDKVPKRGLTFAAWIALGFYLYVVRVGASNGFLYWGGYTLIAIAVGVMLAALLQSSWSMKRFFRFQLLRAVGRVSYGLYLWHLVIFTAVGRYGKAWSPMAQAIVALAAAAAATYLSWVLVERPFLRWKNRLEARLAGR
ncbi:MAG: hypothetical protein QOG50_626 [Actinomycetota bacterium]|nr:hypothetical protein [Actinomycetota bacterium]